MGRGGVLRDEAGSVRDCDAVRLRLTVGQDRVSVHETDEGFPRQRQRGLKRWWERGFQGTA